MADEPTTGHDPQDVRRGQLLNALFDRQMHGPVLAAAETLAGDPELAGELRDCLDLLNKLGTDQSTIDALIAQGLLVPSTDPRFPAELGPYKIVRFLGRGGMGVVLEAYEEGLSRSVALKILRPDLAQDTAALARFEREAKAAAALRHPNIVTVYAIHKPIDGPEAHPTRPEARFTPPYIAMEYIDGPSLAGLIRCGCPSEPRAPASAVAAGLRTGRPADAPPSLPPALIRRIFRELLCALDAAHRAGLIHRDIKSANILLDKSYQPSAISLQPEGRNAAGLADSSELRADSFCVKLADFGLARMRSSQTQMTTDGSVLGTPEYMSPEQARGEPNIDHRTDLYSAGVVLYEMLTGHTPFHADTPTATIHRILHEAPRDPRKLDRSADPVLASLALRLMAKRPEDRLASAAEALRTLGSSERVRVAHHLRLPHRTAVITVLGLAVLSVAAWFVISLWVRPEPISDVRIVRYDNGDPKRTVLEACYGDETHWKRLRWVLPDYKGGFSAAALVDLDGSAKHRTLVVGLDQPLPDDSAALVAFNPDSTRRWGISLSPASLKAWPDCTGGLPWHCASITAANLDDRPGDELVVVAREARDCPTRISIVDPNTGDIRSTFSHMGGIEVVLIQPHFFGRSRPAIVAWGRNNKLDGFNAPDGSEDWQPGDDRHRTDFDEVPVVMVLDPDPARMNGLGPPRTGRMGWLPGADVPAKPHAYAFLDMRPDGVLGRRASSCATFRVADSEVAHLDPSWGVRPVFGADGDCSGFDFQIVRRPGGPPNTNQGGANLQVDRNLQIIEGESGVAELDGEANDPQYWRAHWHVIIRDGEYVERGQ